MNTRFGPELPDPCRLSLSRWLRVWDVPHLETWSRVEWSSRLNRSLARCYPDRKLVRISSHLQGASDSLLEEVLCHEMAHLAARELHGRSVRPHGPEWKALMTKRELRAANAASLPERNA